MKRKIIVIFLASLVILFFVVVSIHLLIYPKKYKNLVNSFSEKYDLEPALVYAIIKQESNFDKGAVSRSGALGLMQILPSTAKWIAGELDLLYSDDMMFDQKYNIEFGCFYLRYLFDKFDDMEIVICAYNAGEGKVLEWIEDERINETLIDYSETKTYLKKVKSYYNIYKSRVKFM